MFIILNIGTSYKKSAAKISCLNGGYKKSKNDTCICPPGFTGAECEIGNFFMLVFVKLVIIKLL